MNWNKSKNKKISMLIKSNTGIRVNRLPYYKKAIKTSSKCNNYKFSEKMVGNLKLTI